MRRLGFWISAAFATATIVVALWGAYQASLLFLAASTTAKLGVITAGVSVATFIYNNSRQQAREIKSRHFIEKRQAYQKFFDFMFEIFELQRTNKDLDEDLAIQRMRDIVKDLMIWGSPETINQYNTFIRNSSVKNDTEFIFSNVEAFLLSLRKDLGHDDRKLEKLGLSKLLLKAEEHHLLS